MCFGQKIRGGVKNHSDERPFKGGVVGQIASDKNKGGVRISWPGKLQPVSQAARRAGGQAGRQAGRQEGGEWLTKCLRTKNKGGVNKANVGQNQFKAGVRHLASDKK